MLNNKQNAEQGFSPLPLCAHLKNAISHEQGIRHHRS